MLCIKSHFGILASSGGVPEQKEVTIPIAGTFTDVATDKAGNWVIVGAGTAIYSNNKTTWTETASSFAGQSPKSVATDKVGNWVILTEGGWIYTSTDNGVTWTYRTSPEYAFLGELVYHSSVNKFYATGINDHMVSANSGVTWTDLNISFGSAYTQSASSGSRVVATGLNGLAVYTDDGTSWSSASIPVVSMRDAWYGNGNFALASNNGKVYYSTSGSGGWTVVDPDLATSSTMIFIVYLESESRWIICDIAEFPEWYESTNLADWTKITAGDFFGLGRANAADVDDSGYVMVTNDGKVYIK